MAEPIEEEIQQEIQKHKNEDVTILAKRGNDTISIPMSLGEDGLIGVYPKSDLSDFFLTSHSRSLS